MHFFDWIGLQWRRRPVVVMVCIFAIAILFDARHDILSDKRPFGAIAETIAASSIYWGSLIASICLGVWVGSKVLNQTSSKILAWVVGISLWFAAELAVFYIAMQIPGVGWRLEKMLKTEYDNA